MAYRCPSTRSCAPSMGGRSRRSRCSRDDRSRSRRPSWAGGKLNATSIALEPLSAEESEVLVRNLMGGLGLDTSGYSIPYIASWSENADSLEIVEQCAGLIDRLAKRIEDAVHRTPQTGTAEQVAA